MAGEAVYGSLPFQQQIDFFRQKLNLPTASWTDIWHEQHDRAFVVAGAMRDDLLGDFRAAVDKAIANGTTLEEFRKDFDSIVEKYGWEYNGGRNWRSKVIYDRNLASSYSAGRWQQIQAVKHLRPFLRYRHMPDEKYPRLDHMAWDGLILPVDHPFWLTHFPQCGWGCQCWVDSLSQRDITSQGLLVTPHDGVDDFVKAKWAQMQKAGLVGADEPPPIGMRKVTVGQKGPHPRTVAVPAGVDPGFGYVPGASLDEPAPPLKPPMPLKPPAPRPGTLPAPKPPLPAPTVPEVPPANAAAPTAPSISSPTIDAPIAPSAPPSSGAGLGDLVQSALTKTTQLGIEAAAESAAETLALPTVQTAIDAGFEKLVAAVAAADQSTNDAMLIGALSPTVVQALADAGIETQTAPILARDVEILHALRSAKARAVTTSGYRKALSADELAQLPMMIDQASAVLLDAGDSTLLYVFTPDNGPRDAVKIVVRVNFVGKVAGSDGKPTFNAFRTASWLDRADLEQMLGSGDVKLVEGEL